MLPPRLPFRTLAGLLLLGSFLIYGQTFGHEFVALDTDRYITGNPNVQGGLTAESVGWAFTSTTPYWHPVTWLSILLDVELFGMDAGWHHLMSALLHGINGVLVYLTLHRLAGQHWLAVWASVLFVVHPQHVESVAWAVERKDLLSTMFMLLAILGYLAHLRGTGCEGTGFGGTGLGAAADQPCGASPCKRARYLAGGLIAYALSLMAKPMAVTLPLLLLLMDIRPLARAGQVPWRHLVLEKWPWFVLAAFGVFSAVALQSPEGAAGLGDAFAVGLRMENALVSLANYLGETFWPTPLAVYYPHPTEIPLWQWSGSAVLLLFITWVMVSWRRIAPFVLVGWIFFLITLLPVLGLVPMGGQSHADRFTYIPHTGLFAALIWACYRIREKYPWLHRPFLVLGVLTVATYGVLAWRQTKTWKNSETLYRHALEVTGRNPKISFNLGVVLAQQNRPSEALPLLIKTLQDAPTYPRGHYTLAAVLTRLGQTRDAAAAFEEAIRIDPQHFEAHFELAALLYGNRNYKAAASRFDAAAALRPQAPEPLYYGAYAALLDGNPNAAVQRAEKLAALTAGSAPPFPGASALLGEALLRAGRPQAALPHLRSALQANPDNGNLRKLLAEAESR